jgi:hypothetical protein
VGSARKASKAEREPLATERSATGIHRTKQTLVRATPQMHPKKAPPRAAAKAAQVAVGTPNAPGYTNRVDAAKYEAMKDILLDLMPHKAPGLTQGEMFDAVRKAASKHTFPGATDRWWAKCVQLDLESKGVLRRSDTSPLRWHRV